MSSPSELAKLIAMASSEASGSVDSCSTSLETRYDVIESSTSEEENQDTHVQAQVVSLLSKLRAPRPSDLSRKRKIATNQPPSGKRKSRAAATESGLKTIKPEKRVAEYPKEPLAVSNGKLFFNGCREELCLKSSSVKNHLSSSKHLEGKKRLDRKEAREQNNQDNSLQDYVETSVMLRYNKRSD